MRTIAVLGLVLVAGTAGAQAPGGGGGGFTPPTFDGIDKDKSGSLSQAEVGEWVKTIPGGGPNGPPNAADVFGRWDANKDGSVSKAEFDSRPRGGGGGPGRGGGPGGGGPPPGGQAPR
jgi:hypothetical protein